MSLVFPGRGLSPTKIQKVRELGSLPLPVLACPPPPLTTLISLTTLSTALLWLMECSSRMQDGKSLSLLDICLSFSVLNREAPGTFLVLDD